MTMDQLLSLVFVSGVAFLPIVLVPTWLHFRHERWKIIHEHERQLRALELGRAMPEDSQRKSWFSPLCVSLIIGAGVPLGAFMTAMVTSVASGFHEAVWIATGMVGLGGVICGSVIAVRAHSESKALPVDVDGKPFVEEDAYDVVSARG